MRFPVLIFLLLMLRGAVAQELWVRPDKYFYNANETAKVDLLRGEDFIGEATPFLRKDVVGLDMLFRSGKVDIRRNFSEGEKASFEGTLSADGIYRFILETAPEQLRFGRTDFDEYVKLYGLEEAYADSVNVSSDDSVVVDLRRFIKCYVRVGKNFDKRPEADLNLPVEIVPDKNPLTLDRGDRITFTIFKNGKPAFGVRVRIWNRWNNRTTIQHIYTLQDGTVSTAISSPGEWMVSVVDLQRKDANAFEGTAFNMIFGYR